MESRIRIAVDFQNGNQPVLHIAKKRSEDVRDELLQSFLESFPSGVNRWAKIVYIGEDDKQGSDERATHYHVAPISREDLQEEMKLMTAYFQQIEEAEKTHHS